MTSRGVWVGKSNEDEWRTRVFSLCALLLSRSLRRMHFYFPSVTCWCEKHNFSIFLLCTYSPEGKSTKAGGKSVVGIFPSFSSFTRQSSSADIKVLLRHQPATRQHQTKKMEKFQSERLFTFILVCTKAAQILRTTTTTMSTLNENEVAINYIKYDVSFFGATLRAPSSSLFEC